MRYSRQGPPVDPRHRRYDEEMRRTGHGGYDRGLYDRPRRGYDRGGDYWWLGEHELERRGYAPAYDDAYVRFAREARPRFSPVGGMYPAMGGRYAVGRPPRPLRENVRFSDWTRWF